MRHSSFFLLILALSILPVGAFEEYSTNGSSGNCATCHGDFRQTRVSLADGQDLGANLHNLHRNSMLGGDCDTCHSTSTAQFTLIGSSDGGDGLPGFGCSGCHGRAEDGIGSGTVGFGSGLRQHHWNTGTTNCVTCHADSNPANATPQPESTLPPYYANPGTGHPDIPSDSCNPSPGFPEDFGGSTLGLDNDGDGQYDGADSDCAVAICGNSVVEAGEDCDDGNTVDGDCCGATCSFEASGSTCDDGAFCTINDVCDGSGTCDAGTARSCDDGEVCTDDSCDEATDVCVNVDDVTNDPSCEPGACGNGLLETGEACDDGNTAGGDCCASDCQFEAAGSACGDGQFCSVDEICDGLGSCADAAPRDCDDGNVCTDDSCDEEGMTCVNVVDATNDPSCLAPCPDDDGDGFAICGDPIFRAERPSIPEFSFSRRRRARPVRQIIAMSQMQMILDCDTTGLTCGDCDDADAAVNPGITENCDNGLDDDCDGLVDGDDADCVVGPECGNGVVEPGEDCDDDSDCCGVDCFYEAAGVPCDDGVFCEVGESCDGAGVCGGGTPNPCEDSDDCTDDTCLEASMSCEHELDATNDPSCDPGIDVHLRSTSDCSICHETSPGKIDLKPLHGFQCSACHTSGFGSTLLGPIGAWDYECRACHNPEVVETGNVGEPTKGHRCVVCHGEQLPTSNVASIHTEHADKANCVVCHGAVPDVGSPDQICVTCHQGGASGSLEQIHRKHTSEGLSCLECHQVRPSVDVTGEGADSVCRICHGDDGSSGSGDDDLHREHADKGLDCGSCHAAAHLQDDRNPMPPIDDPVRVAARNGDPCRVCHSGGEDDDSEDVHEEHVADQQQWCFNCHGPDDGRPLGTTGPATDAASTCVICHSGTQFSGEDPFGIHEEHADKVKCYACHQGLPPLTDWPLSWMLRGDDDGGGGDDSSDDSSDD